MKITEVKKKNGVIVYRAQVYLGVDVITGKKVKASVTANTKTEVRQIAKRKQNAFISNGSTVYRGASAETFRELTALWLDTYKPTVKIQTYDNMVCLIKNHITPQLGAVKLNKLTTPLLQNFVNGLANGAYKEYQTLVSLVRRILAYGVSLQLLPSNPLLNVIVPRKHKDANGLTDNKIKYIDDEQLKQFLGYLDSLPPTYLNQYHTTLYKFLLATGLRIGETLALNWSDIDLDAGTVTVNKTLITRDKTLSTPKTGASYRTISIDKKTILMLRLYHNRQSQYFKEIGAVNDIVFSQGVYDYPSLFPLQQRLTKHFKSAGVSRFTFHAFRHTHASLLLNAGITYKELQHRLGHSKISMTLDIYGHLSKGKEKEAVTFYENALKSL